jgi:hypothetical protein
MQIRAFALAPHPIVGSPDGVQKRAQSHRLVEHTLAPELSA